MINNRKDIIVFIKYLLHNIMWKVDSNLYLNPFKLPATLSTSEANFIYIQMAAKIRSLSTKCSAKLPNESAPNYRKVSFTH